MNLKVLKVALIMTGGLSWSFCLSQSVKDYPVIGETIPKFTLENVHYYTQQTFDSREANGKWIILDFWAKGCTACVQSFPKVNQLQDEFKDHIQFLLVAKNDRKYNENIEQIFDRYRKNLGLNLSIAYDSAIFTRFGIHGVPHVIVVDPQLKVYAVTIGSFINRESLEALVTNKRPAFIKQFNSFEQHPSSVKKWKYLVDQNEEMEKDFIYRSILSEYKGEQAAGSWEIYEYADQGFYQVTRVTLGQLYNIAYWGQADWNGHDTKSRHTTHWKYPILEIRDSSAFQFNYSDLIGLYNYSLVFPGRKIAKEQLMVTMQQQLKDHFHYEISIETRMMPYWKLTANEAATRKLKTTSDSADYKGGPIGLSGKRVRVASILDLIQLYNEDEHFPFIDETNIKEKIDINFSAVMTDMNDVRAALRKHGLILEKSKKEMKVLVIRDPESTKTVETP